VAGDPAGVVPLLAAGVAFFGFLSLFPAVVVAVLAYGLVADPAQIRNQVKDLSAAPRQSLGIGVAIAVVAALWSASGGGGCGRSR
jgi:membrane protein